MEARYTLMEHKPYPILLPEPATGAVEGVLKLLVLVDSPLWLNPEMLHALEDQRFNFEESTGGRVTTQFEFVEHLLDEIPWSRSYYGGQEYYYPSVTWLDQMAQKYRGDADFLQVVIDESHWNKKGQNSAVWGWNVGIHQVIRGRQGMSWQSFKKTFDMELVHSFDQLARTIGYNLNEIFEVTSFDEGVVHAKDPQYAGKRFEYRHVYTRIVDILIQLFPKPMVDKAKLIQITNELLFRNPTASDEVYLERPEAEVRAEVGSSHERTQLIALVGAGRNVSPL